MSCRSFLSNFKKLLSNEILRDMMYYVRRSINGYSIETRIARRVRIIRYKE